MLQYNEVRPGVAVIVDGTPYVCTWNNVMQKQQRKPVNQTKLRNLITGSVIEHSFAQSDKLEEAEIKKSPVVFIYERNGEWFFHPKGDPKGRFAVSEDVVGEPGQFLKSNMEVTALSFEENLFRIELPIKVDLKVVEAPPSIRGNTAQGGDKKVKLETGAMISVPLFIEEGEVIRINTTSGEYVERA